MGAEVWSALANWVMAGAAVGAALTAYRGLNQWSEQLSGQTDHDLARRILVALYQHKGAIGRLRHPFIPRDEMRDEQGNLPDPTDQSKRNQGLFRAYQRRWESVALAHDSLSALLQEAEAVWGAPLPELWQPVGRLENELFFALEEHLSIVRAGDRALNRTKEEADEFIARRKLLSGMGGDGDDFGKRFNEAMKPLEELLRKKLGPKK